MKPFWLDADVLIQAKNSYYAFDIAPGFWGVLEESATEGVIKSPMMVYYEIVYGGDELTRWAKDRRDELFEEADETVQGLFGEIANYVEANYDAPNSQLFLEGADGWVIAAALASEGTVVTHEAMGGYGCKRVKIPNVCKHLGVRYTTCYEMLRVLGKKIG